MKIGCVQVNGETNCGRVRKVNEDNFCVGYVPGDTAVLVVVADGLGGHGDGDKASLATCQALLAAWNKEHGKIRSSTDGLDFLKRILPAVNEMVYSMNSNRIGRPMGCTIALAVFCPDSVAIGHAGDSRIYRLSGDEWGSLTADHTYLALLEKEGKTSKDPERDSSIVMRAVGVREKIDLETEIVSRKPGDRFLFCSDGLYRCVPDEKIRELLSSGDGPENAVGELVRQALIGGAPDNVTVVCVH